MPVPDHRRGADGLQHAANARLTGRMGRGRNRRRTLGRNAAVAGKRSVFRVCAAVCWFARARNECIGLQIGLRTQSPPAGPYSVQVSDLVVTDTRIAAALHVRLYRILERRVESFRSWYPEHAGRSATPLSIPDVLVPMNAPRGSGPVRLDDGAQPGDLARHRHPARHAAGGIRRKDRTLRRGTC